MSSQQESISHGPRPTPPTRRASDPPPGIYFTEQKEEKMIRHIQFVACLFATLCTGLAFAQDNSTNAPAAFVYVSSSRGANHYEINAFTAAANGKLTPVSGSPFAADVQSMAANAKYLFGTNGVNIYSFSIASDGALEKVAYINAQKFNGYNCGGPVALFLDRTGTNLYDEDFYGNICANNTYQSFSIDRSTGELSYLKASAPSVVFDVPLSFIGNNVLAYGSGSYDYSTWIFGFRRNSDGILTQLKINPPLPVAKQGDGYLAFGAAADPTNHIAICVQAINGSTWQPDGPPKLATYTADASGNLTTKSAYWNMPTSAVEGFTDMKMAPSGKLLAVAGPAGLQVFHFNGASAITHYSGLLTRVQIDQVFWDNSNHLYAISHSANQLFVFTITPTSVDRAPGSPYRINSPQGITVLPKS